MVRPIKRSSNKGIALITVMLIVALAAIISMQMIERLQLQIQRTSNIQSNEQAYWYAMGAEALAKSALINGFKKDPDTTNLSQAWAQKGSSFPVEQGSISGEISDLQACFNLNALRDIELKPAESGNKSKPKKSWPRQTFERLLTSLEIEGVDEYEAEAMADSLTDWLDKNDILSGVGGAEDDDYASKEFPYLAANQYLFDVNELRVIEHFTPAVINALKGYVCVIPNDSMLKINVNTVTTEHAKILSALLNAEIDDVEQAISARDEKGFASVDDFINLPEINKIKIKADVKQYLTIDSNYFMLTANAKFSTSFFTLNSILKVTNNEPVQVIARTIGKI